MADRPKEGEPGDGDAFIARLNRNVYEGPRVTARLRALGLEPDWLFDAVLASEIERRNTSPLEPAGAAGSRAWFTGFRVVAEKLIVQDDWRRDETNNLPRMVNTQTRMAVAVCGGDEAVGLRSRSPRSKSQKGNASIGIVRSNHRQMNLFDEPKFRPIPRPDEQVTWWLLVYSDGIGSLRAELSLPVALDDTGHFSEWKERILLHIPPTLDGGLRQRDDDGADLPEVEVTVRPRG